MSINLLSLTVLVGLKEITLVLELDESVTPRLPRLRVLDDVKVLYRPIGLELLL
jgi:hypothetical protein